MSQLYLALAIYYFTELPRVKNPSAQGLPAKDLVVEKNHFSFRDELTDYASNSLELAFDEKVFSDFYDMDLYDIHTPGVQFEADIKFEVPQFFSHEDLVVLNVLLLMACVGQSNIHRAMSLKNTIGTEERKFKAVSCLDRFIIAGDLDTLLLFTKNNIVLLTLEPFLYPSRDALLETISGNYVQMLVSYVYPQIHPQKITEKLQFICPNLPKLLASLPKDKSGYIVRCEK